MSAATAYLPAPAWRSGARHGAALHRAGREDVALAWADALSGVLSGRERPDTAAVARACRGLEGHFACVAETPSGLAAAVDRTRGYPLYWSLTDGALRISGDASAVTDALAGADPKADPDALLEYRMAGYVTGEGTVLSGVRQLPPGWCLAWDAATGEVRTSPWYVYLPGAWSEPSEDDLVRGLDRVVDRIFTGIAERAGGRPIWVPLSGGLDSRLILCKLAEMGYQPLQAFSYGPRGNDEATAAREAARRAGVPWRFVPGLRRDTRRVFHSDLRRDYWTMCGGCAASPNMQDFFALAALRGAGDLPAEAVLINGQSGDFISGGHIPAALLDPDADREAAVSAILDKHYALWRHLRTQENLDRMAARVRRALDGLEQGWDGPATFRAAALYEAWEWCERQSKFIVNQQRTYDFFGHHWELPLWADAFMEFWREVPPPVKGGQALYRRWLEGWDPWGLFTDFRPVVQRWPGLSRLAVPVARAAGLVGGARAKDAVYRRLGWFGHASDRYGVFSYAHFLRRIASARGTASFFSEQWLVENLPQEPGAGA